MRLDSIRSFALRIPFKTAFKHASAERASTQTIWIEAKNRSGLVGFGEGCPREYVTNESLETAQVFVSTHMNEWLSLDWDLGGLIEWTNQHRTVIDVNPAAWAAVELALLDLLAKSENRSV